MRLARVLVVGGALLVGAPPLAAQASDARAPDDALAVRVGDHWVPWWSAARAPARWDRASPVLERAVVWTRIANGVELATLRLTAAGALPFRVVLVRLDPARLHFDLVRATRDEGLAGAWTLDSLPGDALFGVNAGQFVGGTPWGWLVVEGAERQAPGTGSLAMALVLDATGAARLSSAEETSRARSVGDAWLAFQSYPALLVGEGTVPPALRAAGRGVDVAHRDARVALGARRDGRLLVALTRFDALDGALARLPVGPTVGELAALMGGLGCRRAVALDGGLSGQLAVRDAAGRAHRWDGLRRVPLALVARPRR